MSLKKRIQIILLFLVLVPLLLLLLQSYRTSRSTLQQQIREGSLQIAQLEAKEMDLIFDPPRYIIQGLVRALEAKPHLDADGVRDLLRSTLIQTPGIFGVAVGFEPEATPLGRFCHYYYRPGGEVKERSML
ncbi:MAG: hypothetical protein LLF99_10830, partial [Desulfobacteraceae bacterium]|nr:hypothetical protein [Desulfobacteraceae bacterium]